ncbi:hypothetical protein H4R33_005921 [Dimargaris cristalligena]|uniref:Inner membrane component domain-containing protein n=1 Tax=Dimargaris cristalligena TaxID=215637 RepID=A0A4P9ZQP2_9FUNG|nr:hypothetical protein H4R33_005921 [Dimargaris cristalligena]RKP35438.1 hypothetical protein BJ085DRAFT_34735 [Dimargaris cristalligena]|eukprot:RKP35438.1 hypothetical protein BJ085DRAFT_34735 [Dimargaris cristalligena]
MGGCGIFGNIIWVILGGWVYFLYYAFGGVLFCLTIIGIPFGMECFKLALLSIWPFGKNVTWRFATEGCLSTVFNVIWLIFLGWHLCLINLFMMLIFAVTIVGLPCAKQCWKLAKVALWPFGTTITESTTQPIIAPY